jgi:c(7)-type cytochrome triheme protein
MKKHCIVAVIAAAALVLSVQAFAVPSGKIVVLEPKGAGKVVFDGKMHADKGFKCADCHPGVFKMKKDGDAITMKDIREGKFCGTCHNGTKAFNAKDAVSCSKCHKN